MPNLPKVEISQLPPQVQTTLNLIAQGGSFPHPKDGTTFKNLEGRLPAQPPGYYREYTVPTPGVTIRGTRRLILGQYGEMYYTADHYNSFQEVLSNP